MKTNVLLIRINKPITDVFRFCITPPNSTRWIGHCIGEETSDWPVQVGIIYTLHYDNGTMSKVTVSDIKENEYIEWVSQDKNYHCRYSFKSIDNKMTELEYSEWVEEGEIDSPFELNILEKLKRVLEK
jgi:hypothetical protein